ncbi:MAG: DUF2341 domain-containing protein [Kiritimatiellae bacterium]|nr:DUF2341 domain-containing protein [Kiritimatiellia bacterium]
MIKRISRPSSFPRSEAVLRGIAAAVLAGAACTATASADTIDASAFAGHFDIMFPGYAGAAPVENFPVLVRLSAERNGFDYAACQALGADLRFADAAGNLLPCEVDTWTPGGESLVWVKVPSLSRSTRITAYYGCANPPANTPSAVWSNGFVGVWHLGGSALPLKESSGVGTDFDTSKDNGETLGAPGAVGGAVDFATGGRTGRLSAADDPDLDGFSSFSVELWSKQAAGADYLSYMLTKTATGAYAYTLCQNKGTTTTNSVFYVFSDATNDKRKNIAGDSRNLVVPTMGVWNHQAFVRDLAKEKSFSYLDGTPVPEGGKTLTADEMVAVCDSSSPLYLGNATGNNPSAAFPGQIDELRISNVARSADWVKATHDCVADADFAAYEVGNDWTKYARKFTVSFPGAPDGTLADFPVLVKVAENSPAGFSYADCAKPEGRDLRFADADGNLLACEVDTWNTNGASAVWVKVPALTASTKITAYYGWSFAPPVDATNVWDSGYVGVWHLGESALPLKESSGTSTDFTETMNGGETLASSGAIGGAVDFTSGTGTNRLEAADHDALDGFSSFTVELWSKQISPCSGHQPYILTKIASGQYAYLFYQNKSAQSVFKIGIGGTDNGNIIDGISMVPLMGDWNHQVVIRDTENGKAFAFLNGSNLSSDGAPLVNVSAISSSTSPLYLGNANGQGKNPFPGQIDELRISKVARSAAWVKATHDTVAAPSFARYSATRGNNDATVISIR